MRKLGTLKLIKIDDYYCEMNKFMKKYERIAQDIEELIQVAQYKTGDKLPSIIEQARKYECSRGTVIRAY